MRRKWLSELAASVLLWFGTGLAARAFLPGSLDTTFQPVVDGEVRAILALPDGKVLIGGRFQTVNGLARSGLARLNEDGTVDPSFNPGAGVAGDTHRAVNAMVAQPDGKVLIGGAFTNVNGAALTNIARLEADGTLVSEFEPGAIDDPVRSLAVQADGRMLLGRDASNSLGPAGCQALRRLNSDGSFDPSFTAGLWMAQGIYLGGRDDLAGLIVRSIVVQTNRQIVVQGNFYVPNSDPQILLGVARLNPDGTLDSSFPGGPAVERPGMPGRLRGIIPATTAMAAQEDGKILMGGNFV